MSKNVIRVFALGLGLTALLATTPLSAQVGIYAEKVTIPFAFRVGKMTMPAGEYRVDKEFGKDIVILVNLQTGHKIQLLQSEPTRIPGKTKLVFQDGPEGHVLKSLS